MSAAVAGVLRALVQAAVPAPPPIVADVAALDAKLTADTNTQKIVLRALMTTELDPLLTELQKPATYNFNVSKVATLQTPQAQVNAPVPANDLPNAKYKQLDHKLAQFDILLNKKLVTLDIRNASRILGDFRNDPGRSWSFPTNPLEARQQFLELIALKGLYLRLMAAIDAAKMASVPLADSLALYRAEGDLVMPLPQAHLDSKLPPFESGYSFFLSRALQIKPTMMNGLWSYDKAAFIADFGVAALAAAGGAPWEEFVKFIVFRDWLLLIAGFDYLSKKMAAGVTLPGNIAAYNKFCHDVRTANAVASVPADRAAAYRAQIANLKLSEVSGRLVVAPINPVLLVSETLGHSLLFMKAAGKPAVDGPFITPPAALNYLAHHTSDTRDAADPMKDKFSWILASAGVALAKKAAAPAFFTAATNTHTKIKTLGLPAALPNFPDGSSVSPPEHGDAATKIKAGLNAAQMDELAQFVLRAEAADWGAFKTHRANIARYARAHAYYKVVAAP